MSIADFCKAVRHHLSAIENNFKYGQMSIFATSSCSARLPLQYNHSRKKLEDCGLLLGKIHVSGSCLKKAAIGEGFCKERHDPAEHIFMYFVLFAGGSDFKDNKFRRYQQPYNVSMIRSESRSCFNVPPKLFTTHSISCNFSSNDSIELGKEALFGNCLQLLFLS